MHATPLMSSCRCVLQCVAVCCSVLQCVAVYCCSVFMQLWYEQANSSRSRQCSRAGVLLCVAVLCCSVVLHFRYECAYSSRSGTNARTRHKHVRCAYIGICIYMYTHKYTSIYAYGVAMISRLLKMISLFCTRAL